MHHAICTSDSFGGGAVALIAVVFQNSLGEIGHAQQSGVPAEAPGFIGKTATLDTIGYSVGWRIFAPGSHNATWHMIYMGKNWRDSTSRGLTSCAIERAQAVDSKRRDVRVA